MMDFNIINNDVEADEILEQMAEIKAEISHIEDTAEQRVKRINDWKAEELAWRERKLEVLEESINYYFGKWREENPNKKTLSLAYGKIQSRKLPDKWIYPEDDDLISKIKKLLPDLIETKEKINKNNLKKKLKVLGDKVIIEETGEILDCIKIEEQGEKVTVKVVGE